MKHQYSALALLLIMSVINVSAQKEYKRNQHLESAIRAPKERKNGTEKKQETQKEYKPVRYRHLLEITIHSLEERKKALERKLGTLKQRTVPKKSGHRSASVALIMQGNQAVIATLEETRNYITKRLTQLNEENKKLKNNTLGIKDKKSEELFIKSFQLKNSLDESEQRIMRAQRTEQFFEKQKKGKTREEKEVFDTLKQDWAKKIEELNVQRRRQRVDLSALSGRQ